MSGNVLIDLLITAVLITLLVSMGINLGYRRGFLDATNQIEELTDKANRLLRKEDGDAEPKR